MSPCDGERHYHDVSAALSLPPGASQPADCQCGGGSLRITRTGGTWQVALLDGTPVLAPMVHGLDGTQLVVGVCQPFSEA